MIKLVRGLSINGKMLLALMFSGLLSMLIASVCLAVLEIKQFKDSAQHDLQITAKGIASRTDAALLFDDKNLAGENLLVLAGLPEVIAACVYDETDAIFAWFSKSMLNQADCPLPLGTQQAGFNGLQLVVIEPMVVDGQKTGTVYIRSDLGDKFWLKLKFIATLFVVLLLTSIVTFMLASPVLKLISKPIDALVGTVKNMTLTKDYSLRATKVNNDELGMLVDAFNRLMAKVEQQNLALTQAKDRYLALYDDNPTIILNLNQEGRILSANASGADQLGYRVDELLNQLVYAYTHPEDLETMRGFIEFCMDTPSQIHRQEIRMTRQGGQIIWVRESARVIENENHTLGLLLVCEDITEAYLLNEKIAYQSSHDVLTGLANRRQFEDFANQLIYHAQAESSEHLLCYLDVDQFKVINDTCGHLAGDELIRQLGELLRTHLRRGDLAARLGGDEFGVLIRNCPAGQIFNAGNNLREIVNKFQFLWENSAYSVTASIGMVAINRFSSNALDLFREADAACYAAKDSGRNRVHLYSLDDIELVKRQGEMQWVSKIHQGIEQNRFCLFGQPIAACFGTEGLHFETLIRYVEDDGKIIAPGMFLPAAERYNLSPNLDRWVIGELFRWLAGKPEFLAKLSLCSVNLSGLSICDETVLAYVHEQFTQWRIPADKICFEITETAAIANLSSAIKFINSLKEIGCLFSLDDFGSGLSSFAYLKSFPVDFLKIDGTFVKGILDDRVDLAMVRSINEVSHVLGKKTIAEFVENRQIFDLLKLLGVDYAQGYGIGKPVPLDALKPEMAKPFPVG